MIPLAKMHVKFCGVLQLRYVTQVEVMDPAVVSIFAGLTIGTARLQHVFAIQRYSNPKGRTKSGMTVAPQADTKVTERSTAFELFNNDGLYRAARLAAHRQLRPRLQQGGLIYFANSAPQTIHQLLSKPNPTPPAIHIKIQRDRTVGWQ
jgi:hypothetical protein